MVFKECGPPDESHVMKKKVGVCGYMRKVLYHKIQQRKFCMIVVDLCQISVHISLKTCETLTTKVCSWFSVSYPPGV